MTVLKLADVELLKVKKEGEDFRVTVGLVRPTYSYLEVIMYVSHSLKVERSRTTISIDQMLLEYSRLTLEQQICSCIKYLFEPLCWGKDSPFNRKDLVIDADWVKETFFYKGEPFNPEYLVDTENLKATPDEILRKYSGK